MKRNYDNYLHYIAAAVGGWFGGFAAMEIFDMFGNAQSMNLIGVVKSMFEGEWYILLLRIIGALVYFLGLSLSVLVPKFTKIRSEQLSLTIDTLALIALALLPENTAPIIKLYPIFFASSYQWTVFDKIEGYVCSTIFSSNNYRQFTTSLLSYAIERDKNTLAKARVFGFTLLYFHLGVALSCAGAALIGKGALITGLVPILAAEILLKIRSKASNSPQAQ